MPEQSWTIGSASSCDLVVNNHRVSGQHCRLQRNGNELRLTDLDSTNGTYVNGERVKGTRSVKTSDTITLGQTQPMPWPSSLQPAESTPRKRAMARAETPSSETIISIGRGPKNTVTVQDTNVSTNHARLVMSGPEIILEDLGSTNGTSIGEVENKIRRGAVEPTDTIFLGSTPYLVSDLIARSNSTAALPRISAKQASQPSTAKQTGPLVWIASSVVVLFLVVIGWFVTREAGVGKTAEQDATASSALVDETRTSGDLRDASENGATPTSNLASTGASSAAAPDNDPSQQEQPELSAEEKFALSTFLVVCSDTKRETPFRCGTAFAIDANTIVTSATVVQAMKALQQNEFSEAFLFCPQNKAELKIVSTIVHPQFTAADKVARKAEQSYDEIYDRLAAEPPKPETFAAVKDRLMESRLGILQAMDKKATHDVAIITTSKPLSHWLQPTTAETQLRPNQKVNVTGYAIDLVDPFFDHLVPFEPSTMSGRIGQLVAGSESKRRLVGRGGPELNEYAFEGSPVLDARGQVVGIYSRKTPPATEVDKESSQPTFDAALFERVRECRKL